MKKLSLLIGFALGLAVLYLVFSCDSQEPELDELVEPEELVEQSVYESTELNETEYQGEQEETEQLAVLDESYQEDADLEQSYEDSYQEQQLDDENVPQLDSIEQVSLEEIASDSVDEENSRIDELLIDEPIDQEWAGEIEDRISNIFTDSDNYVILSESGLDFSYSECRTTVCQINFIPNIELDKSIKMKQLLSLTSFLGQDNAFSTAQLNTKYTDEGFLSVTLQFKR